MEGIAQANDRLGLQHVDQGRQHRQGLARVVARQELAGIDGVGRALLEMQVGHRQQAPRRPVQGACRQCLQLLAGAVELERLWQVMGIGWHAEPAGMPPRCRANSWRARLTRWRALRKVVRCVAGGFRSCRRPARARRWPAAQVQPHRAEYALRLGAAANAPRIGTAVHDLSPGLRRLASQARHQDRDRAHGLVEDEPRLQARRPRSPRAATPSATAPCRSRTAASARFKGRVQRQAGEITRRDRPCRRSAQPVRAAAAHPDAGRRHRSLDREVAGQCRHLPCPDVRRRGDRRCLPDRCHRAAARASCAPAARPTSRWPRRPANPGRSS